MYSTLAQFKDYLHIDQSDTSQDSLLTEFLNSAWNTINKLCGVESFNSASYEEDIDVRGIYDTFRWLEFYLKNKPVSSISELNWESAGEKGTDYMIICDRRVIAKRLLLNDFWFLHVKYSAWYQTIPDDIKLMEMMLASWLWQQHGQEWVSSYKLWDEQIVFGNRITEHEAVSPDDQYYSFRALLSKYQSFNLPV